MLLGSCDRAEDGPGAAPSSGDGRGSGTRPPGRGADDPTSGSAPTPQQRARAFVDQLEDRRDLVRDLRSVDLSDTLGVPITFPRPTAARGLAEALDITVSKLMRECAARAAAAPTVTAKVVAASQSVLGVLLDATDSDGSAPCLVWYHAVDDRAVTSPALIRPESWSDLVEAVRKNAGAVPGIDLDALCEQLHEQPRPWGNGPAIIPDSTGALRVLFPAAPVSGSHAEVLVEIEEDTGAELLSDVGRQIGRAMADPAEFDPEQVTQPDPGRSEDDYESTTPMLPPVPAREPTGPGPRTQLAPRTQTGTAPASVTAPDASRLRTVALTFDDGPSEKLNPTLLSHLREHGAAATFFFIGSSIDGAAGACAATAAAGHEIGGHSWSHTDLSKASAAQVHAQINRTSRAIESATGIRPTHMRPPYGARNTTVDSEAGAEQQSVQLWSVDSLDWRNRDVQRNLREVTSKCRRGDTVLMHEIHEESVATVPPLLDWFEQEGYTLLTCCEIGQNQMRAGRRYRHGACRDQPGPTAPSTDQSG